MKRRQQLGMNPSTARGRLVKDILWKLIVQTKQDVCCKCNHPMDRNTFSIEHIKPWLDSENPLETFFDLENISFSHLSCNCKDSRGKTGTSKYPNKEAKLKTKRETAKENYTSEKRREKYLKTGH